MPQLNFSPLGGEGPQNFLQGYTQGQEIRNRLAAQEQQRQLADIQLQNALREQRMAGEEEAAYKSAGGDINRLQSELMQRGLGKQSLAVGAQLSKQRADQLAQQKTIVELSRDTAKRAMANPENAAQIYANFGRQLGVDVSDDLAEIQKFGGNPEAIRQWAASHALEADKLLPKFQQFETPGGGRALGAVNPLTAQFTPSQVLAPQMTPYQQQHLAQMQQRLSAESAVGALTPETLDFAAQVYAQSGQLPPLGIGKGAAQIKAQIMNRAAQIAMGGATPTPEAGGAPGAAPTAPPVSAAAAASNVIGAKQNVAAQSAALKSFNTGVEGRAVRSFNTAIDHLDTMDKLATALNNNDMKAFNSVSQAFASQFGVAAPTNFDAAKAIVGGEVAKALTGANMALKDREEIRDTLNRANSPAQLKGVITTLQHLMGGQLKSLETQYTSSTGRKDFEGKLSKRSKEVVRTLGGETGAAGGAPTPGTVMDGYRFKGGDPANQANWEKL